MEQNQEFSEESLNDYSSNYSEKGFWNKVKKVAKKAGAKVIYVALLLYYEMLDPDISLTQKGAIVGALGYFILPIDLIPDFIPIAGYADDLAALTAAYHLIRSNITPYVRDKAHAKLSDWFGEVDGAELNIDDQ